MMRMYSRFLKRASSSEMSVSKERERKRAKCSRKSSRECERSRVRSRPRLCSRSVFWIRVSPSHWL